MIDGSKIRAAREAKGWSQAQLAEAVGTTQQTIDKIERGVISRTTYLSEINAVLEIALNSSLADRIRTRLTTLNKNPSSVALEAGLGRSAVRDILVNDQNPRIDTLQKLTGPLECTLAYLTGEGNAVGPLANPVGSADAIQVLRTILCANPTAEQIIAALAANGLEIVASAERLSSLSDIPNDPLDIVREILERRKISANKLASLCGLAPSTLNRALNKPDHKFMLSTRTLKKIRDWDAQS